MARFLSSKADASLVHRIHRLRGVCLLHRLPSRVLATCSWGLVFLVWSRGRRKAVGGQPRGRRVFGVASALSARPALSTCSLDLVLLSSLDWRAAAVFVLAHPAQLPASLSGRRQLGGDKRRRAPTVLSPASIRAGCRAAAGTDLVFYSVCCICCLSRRDCRGWDAMAYPRPACLGGEMLGLAYARRCDTPRFRRLHHEEELKKALQQ